MEKALYDLEKNVRFQNALPSQEDKELTFLEESIKRDGCQDSIKTWHGTIVDGYTRYDICHRLRVPFAVEEMDFADEDEAYLWIIRNQLGRRNLPPFVKCELVLPLERQLRIEGKERQIRKPADFVLPNLAEQKNHNTRDRLAEIAGLSHGSIYKAKWLQENADEDTLNRLRRNEISIHRAYTDLKGAPERSQSPSSKIIQFPSAARHQPDWPTEEEPDWPVEEDADWPDEEVEELAAPVETPTSTFDPGPDMDDINAIIQEIQDNSKHYADRLIELLSRIQPKDATTENIGFISSTIDSIFTAIKKQIKEVHINEQ